MQNWTWLKDLIRAEEQLKETGIDELAQRYDPGVTLDRESVEFLTNLKQAFAEAALSYNQLKPAALAMIKIYAIAKTEADFMLFRNGFKMIFSLREPGVVIVKLQQMASNVAGASVTDSQMHTLMDEDLLVAQWGAFGDLQWTYEQAPIKVDYVVRHYMTTFVREST